MTEKTARVWAEDFYRVAESHTTTTVTGTSILSPNYGTWADFTSAFKRAFAVVDSKGAVMVKLTTWKQRHGTPASSHITTMNNFITQAQITEYETKKAFLLASLDQELLVRLFNSGLATAANYTDLVDNILGQENNMNMLKAIQGRTKRSFTTQNPRYTSTPSRTRDPNAMDVDATDIRPKRLTDAEREDLRKKGGCFKCREIGHISTNCKKVFKKPLAPARAAKVEEVPEEEEETPMDACATALDF